SAQAKPSRDWLAHIHTARARHKIRQWNKQEEHAQSLSIGRDMLAREVQRRRLTPPDDERLAKAAATLSVGSPEQLQAALGSGHLPIGQAMRALYPDLSAEDLQPSKATGFGRVNQAPAPP